MRYTKTIHEARHELDLTPNEYYVCDIISRSQANKKYSIEGYCKVSYGAIADMLFLEKSTVLRISKKLQTKGMLHCIGVLKKVDEKWHLIHELVEKPVAERHQHRVQVATEIGSETPPNEKPIGSKLPPASVAERHQHRVQVATEIGSETPPHKVINKSKVNSKVKGGWNDLELIERDEEKKKFSNRIANWVKNNSNQWADLKYHRGLKLGSIPTKVGAEDFCNWAPEYFYGNPKYLDDNFIIDKLLNSLLRKRTEYIEEARKRFPDQVVKSYTR